MASRSESSAGATRCERDRRRPFRLPLRFGRFDEVTFILLSIAGNVGGDSSARVGGIFGNVLLAGSLSAVERRAFCTNATAAGDRVEA